MEDVLRRYEYRLGRAAAYTSPGHVTDLLGPLPDRLAATERWQAAAGAIEAYRSRWNVTDTRDRPGAHRPRAARALAYHRRHRGCSRLPE